MPAVDFSSTPHPYSEEHFWRVLTTPEPAGALPNLPGRPLGQLRPGRATGRLLGGNLSLLVSSLGTPYSPAYGGALLVLEDVHEHLHRLDRMLTQLRNAGVFDRIAGLILGRFTQCRPSDPKQPWLPAAAIFAETLSGLTVPAVDRFQYGHVPAKLTLPLGARARLDAGAGRIVVLEAAVT
jgi:muramoyltetrapeptide carboxypeptidase